jgi:hypothetical protein
VKPGPIEARFFFAAIIGAGFNPHISIDAGFNPH